MPTLLWQRDLADDASGVRNTFSSWDSCMAESYCKWPAIIGIIIGSLIVISIIWCCTRCLCCGAECCCGCLSCFNRCCPSPRRSKSAGYEKPQPYNSYNSQYQSPAPMYFGGYTNKTATFDSPGNKNYNEDSLPAMPTWSTAQSKRVEEDNLEMEKLSHQPTAQQQGLLHQRRDSEDSIEHNGDIGGMHATPYAQKTPYHEQQNQRYGVSPYQEQSQFQEQSPYHTQSSGYEAQGQTQYYGQMNPYQEQNTYHAYSQDQQFAGSPTSPVAASEYPPTYQTRPPSSVYTNPYGAAPSYRTAPPSIASPPPQHAQMNGYGMGRKPVNGSWRDV